MKEELGESEWSGRPTDIRWMLGNAVCYSKNTDTHTHTQQGSERESQAPRNRHTHTYVDVLCSNNRLTDELFCDRLLLSIRQTDDTCITNAGGNMD